VQRGIGRAAQDAFAAESHRRALAARDAMRAEIVPLAGLDHDPYARALAPRALARIPLALREPGEGISRVGLACTADGAAFVLLATAESARRLGCAPRFAYRAGVSIGGAPDMPMLAILPAARTAAARAGTALAGLWGVELHEAFAVQALCVIADLGLDPARVGRGGGGLGRGHPIGASGAVSLVRLLADMEHLAPPGAQGLATIAAAGGLGAAVIVERL
jgi:acetyl-CoA C-acetyltransferase